MIRPCNRWLTVAAAALLAGAVLPASAALADTTPGSITGHLLDATAPVPNVVVDLIDPNGNFVGEATTDGAGAFSIPDVAPGAYVVQFSLAGGLNQYYHDKFSFDSADRITVAAGATTSVEETVVPHGSLGGTLIDSSGAPVAASFVSVASTAGTTFLFTTTDAAGHYLLPIVPAGFYTVTFASAGQVAHNKPLTVQGDAFAVTVGSTTTVNEQLVARGTFTGRVTTADGLPAAGIEVFASGANDNKFALTDADGKYSMSVFPGAYKLAFEQSFSTLTEWAPQQTTKAAGHLFTVDAGGTATVDEQLLPTGTLAGHLVDANGQPVPAIVTIAGNGQTLSAFTNNGDWQSPAFPGVYTVRFDTFGEPFGKQWATGKSTAAAADQLTVQIGQTTRVDDTLAVPGTVTLTVVDSVTGAPVQNYCAQIGGSGGCTDNGSLTSGALLPGDAEIVVFPSENHLLVDEHATVVSGQDTAVRLVAVPGASITTTVRDAASGAPLAGICLSVFATSEPSGASPGLFNCTDASGVMTIGSLVAGAYNVFAFANDGVHGHQWVGPQGGTGLKQKAASFSLTAGQSLTIPDIKMDKAGTLTGVIRDKATGNAIPGAVAAWATAADGVGTSNADVTADANGRYVFNNLGPYDWPIFFSAPGYASEWSGNTGDRLKSNPVTVKAGKTRSHNETLTQGVSLTGLVIGQDGQPVGQSSRVVALSADSRDQIGASDGAADGTFTIHALPRQSVVLHADIFVDPPLSFFYPSGSDFEHATPIPIQRPGPIVVNITAPTG
jgi:hypothetical protein